MFPDIYIKVSVIILLLFLIILTGLIKSKKINKWLDKFQDLLTEILKA